MFIDREDAARQLARELAKLKLHDPIVLAIRAAASSRAPFWPVS
jgi:predicted phosphoribosyltransferase